MAKVTFRIWRGEKGEGAFKDYQSEVGEGMVVLDVVHQIQAEQAPDLACRWNCKAGKCGSCSAEINGKPRLMCMTRLEDLPTDQPVVVEPMQAFPHVKDLVTDVSWKTRMALGTSNKRMSSGFRNSASASSVSFAKTSATSFASTRRTTRSSDRVSSCIPLHLRCIRWTLKIALKTSRSAIASATATSPSAARSCAPNTSRSPTTLSSR